MTGKMRPIRVLQFVPGFNYGGIETVLVNTVTSARPDKLKIDVLVEGEKASPQLRRLKEQGCAVHTIGAYSPFHMLSYYKQLMAVLRAGHYDIVHAYNITRSWLLFLAARKCKVPIRLFHARTSKTDGKLLIQAAYRLFIRLGTGLSTHLLANSEESGRFFFKGKPFRVIKNAIDLDAFAVSPEHRARRRSELGLEDGFVLGHVGRFTEAKNHGFLVDIFKAVLARDDTARLLLVGDGPLFQPVVDKVKLEGIEGKVRFAGARNDVPEWYCAMDVFVFPSLYEGYGNAAVEAQAAGLPVVASAAVPRTVVLTDRVHFMPASSSLADWAERILDTKGARNPRGGQEAIDSKGFGMDEASDSLYDYYRAICRKETE